MNPIKKFLLYLNWLFIPNWITVYTPADYIERLTAGTSMTGTGAVVQLKTGGMYKGPFTCEKCGREFFHYKFASKVSPICPALQCFKEYHKME